MYAHDVTQDQIPDPWPRPGPDAGTRRCPGDGLEVLDLSLVSPVKHPLFNRLLIMLHLSLKA